MKEFDFINSQLVPLSDYIGDDCAFFDAKNEKLAVTKDVLAAGVHFFADDEPFNLAQKIIRVNLSDLAACGARPFGVLIGAAIEKKYFNQEWLAEFMRGVKADMQEFDFALLGGDTTTHNSPSVFSVTAIGKTNKPIKRSTAKAGDNIFVSGNIGDGFIGLKTRSGKYILPQPRIELGLKLQDIASACIDISDGLLADLGHICTASGVGAELEAKKIPVSSTKYDLLDLITGGDDYELCFTAPVDKVEGCYKIGKIITGSGIKLDGNFVKSAGWQHKSN